MAHRAAFGERVLVVALGATLVTVLCSAIPDGVYAVEDSRSGTVLSIDQSDGTSSALVLRVGPWLLKNAAMPPGSAPLRIKLKSTTDVLVVTRAKSADATGRVGVLSRSPANMEAVKPGSYVTVTFAKIGNELTAERIEVMAEPLELYPAPPPAPTGLVIQPK